MKIIIRKYDYNKERPWISALFDMQIEANKNFQMRLKRLEEIMENVCDMVYRDHQCDIEDMETPGKMGMTGTSGNTRWK